MVRHLRPVLVAVALMAAVAPHGASAQQTPAVELVDASGPIEPGGTIRFALQMQNRGTKPVDGLRVTMSIHESIGTRYGLERSFTGKLGPTIGSDTIAIEGQVAPGEKRTVEVSKPVSEISFFRSIPQDRAYPVRITVRAGRVVLGTADTYIVYFSEAPTVPLGISLLVPLHSPPTFTRPSNPTAVATSTLERALVGRLDRIVKGLEADPDLPVTIAPSGVLLEMLADMADGYERMEGRRKVKVGPEDHRAISAASMIARIKALAARPDTKVIATPFAMAPLPSLVKNELEDRAQAQVDAGLSRISARLSPAKPMDGWLMPGAGALDERTIAALQRARVSSMVVESGTLRDTNRTLTRGTPATVRTRTGGSVVMVVRDSGLEKHLKADLDQTTARQRFMADAAIAMQERPAASRVVAVSTPLDWDPEVSEADRLFSAISGSTWLKPMTVDAAVAAVRPPAAAADLAPVDAARSGASLPGDYLSALREAKVDIDRFSELGPPASRLAGFEQRLLISESGDWVSTYERGRDLARSIRPQVQAEFDKIKAPAPQTITLTSRDGVIPLLISSELDYPANVSIRLDSDKLRFPDGDRISQKLQPPNQQIVVKAVTKATGTFPLRVVVETPESGITIASTRLVIRSTAYNIVGVAITAGAAIFLVGFWVIGAARRRLAPA